MADFYILFRYLPNSKADINSVGAISTDFLGGSWDYVEAYWPAKLQIWDSHKEYLQIPSIDYCITVMTLFLQVYIGIVIFSFA